MKVFSLLKKILILLILIQLGFFIFVKQRYSELERKNERLEVEINKIINDNNLLKIKLTTIQNQYRIRKLVDKYASNFKPFKPNQVIEKENI